MKFKQYINEKMGAFRENIERTAWMEKDSGGRYEPTKLEWKLVNASTNDDKRNYSIIEDISWKELKEMQRKKVLDFMEDKYDVSKIGTEYYAEVTLNSYDPKPLIAQLKKFKFKIR